MGFFDRWRAPQVTVALDEGFWVAETAAMQRAIVPLTMPDDGSGIPAQLEFTAGAEGRVVVQWRNRFVGFVPPSHEEMIGRQLAVAGKIRLVADGEVRRHGDLWRIWAGPAVADGAPPPPPPIDEIPPETPTIFGIPIAKSDRPQTTVRRRTPPPAPGSPSSSVPESPALASAASAASADGAGPTASSSSRSQRWLLAVDDQSWEVRDGTDIDVPLLRRRIAEADPGARLHLRLWEETVTIELTPQARVTLTDPATGVVEVLHPR